MWRYNTQITERSRPPNRCSVPSEPQFDATGVGPQSRVSPNLTPLMSVISILSPSSALDVRVASGHQHARRPSVMLRFRDRATPSFLVRDSGAVAL